jgi:PAS domain S-box-containing protein
MRSETENQKAAGWLPEDILLPQDRSAILLSTNPALLLAGDGRLPLWASDAAARALGFRDAQLFMRRRLAEAAPGAQRLAELAASLEEGGPARLERLRFFVGFRRVSVTALCQVIRLANGARGLLVFFPADDGDEDEESGSLMPSHAVHHDLAPPAWLSDPAFERRMHRFVFTLDAQGTILTLSPALSEIVGTSRACKPGDNLADFISAFDEAAGLRLEHAFAAGGLWSNIALDWPVEGCDIRVPTTLAALPANGGGGGFSGFGRLHLEALPATPPQVAEPPHLKEAAPEHDEQVVPPHSPDGAEQESHAPAAAHDPAPETLIHAEPAQENAASDDDPPDDDPAPEAHPIIMADSGSADIAPEAPPQPERPASKDRPGIITLHPLKPSLPPPANVVTLREGHVMPANGTTPQRGGLSLTERHAFREIAKALGARFDEDTPSDVTSIQGYAATRQPSRTMQDGQENKGDVNKGDGPINTPAHPSDMPGEQASFWPDVQEAPPVPELHVETLLDSLPIGLLILQGDSTLYANRTLTDLTGYPDLATFLKEDGAQAIFRKGALPRASDAGFDTVVLATREGEMVPVDAHLQIVDWKGTPATLISMRRAVELEQGKALRSVAVDLRRARAEAGELRNILDTATDGVLTLDDEGRIISLNSAAEALFGLNQNEVVGEPFLQLLMHESHADALDYLEGMKANGVKSVLNDGREVYGRERKGGRIPLFMTLGHISDAEPRRFCAVLRDLTAWKRAESQLQEAKRLAENASAKKSDFLTRISHEIRTPINAIIGFAEVMEEERLGPISNPRYKEYLGDIRMSGRHVVSLVNDLLDLAKIEAGRMEMNFEATDINAVINGCIGIIQPQANTNRVLVRSQLATKLPRVVADERSVRQIVLNMLSNATRYTESGGQVIVSTALLDTGEAVIRIRDTGVGMTPSEIEKALEPFHQVGTNRQGGGTGLGLPLTKALVDANRASFAIRSRPGEGTLVEITFPATRVLAE